MMMIVRAVETTLHLAGLARSSDDPKVVRRVAVRLSEHRFVEYGAVGASIYHLCSPGFLGDRGPITDAANAYLAVLERYPEFAWVGSLVATLDLRVDLVRAVSETTRVLRDPLGCPAEVADFVTRMTFSRHDLSPLTSENVMRILEDFRS
ncbi:MAG: hypothetical protein H6724_15620 [Sandaracinus sp.]|nr:hypothetical protein [Sandaracinus sp.]